MHKKTKEDIQAEKEGFYRYKLKRSCTIHRLPKGRGPTKRITNRPMTDVMPTADRIKLRPVWVRDKETQEERRVFVPRRGHSRRKKAAERAAGKAKK